MTENFPLQGGTAETYHGILRCAEAELGLRALAPEFEIFTALVDIEKLTPLELRAYFSGSNTSFYQTLGDLEAKGALSSEPNPADKRSKLYRLSDFAKEQLAARLGAYRAQGREKTYTANEPNEVIARYGQAVRTGLKVSMFTAEFQILLQIQAAQGISNLECANLVDVSPSKFNDSLRNLRKMGYVFFETDPKDHRKKQYYLEKKISEIMSELDRRIFDWIDANVKIFDVTPH